MSSTRLEGKAAVVTGAGGGIGSATAIQFVKEGAVGVVCADINLEAAQETVSAIEAEFGKGKAVAIKADVSKVADCKQSIDLCVSKFGRIDIYFANAGILGSYRPIADESEESFMRALEVNTLGPFMAIKYASEAMKKTADGGSIIVTSSIAAIRSDLTPLQYAASKGAVASMVVAANDRLLLDNVRVNAVLPGGVLTPMVMGVQRDLDKQGLILKGYDMSRFPTIMPEQIATIVAFLASDEAAPIKGHCLVADGGMSNSMGSQPYPVPKPPKKDKKAKL